MLQNSPYYKALAHCEIGRYYNLNGDFKQCEKNYLDGFKLFDNLKKTSKIIDKSLDLSEVYDKIRSFDKKIKILRKVDSIAQKTKLSTRQFYALNNSYANYYNNEETFSFEKASYYYHNMLAKAIALKDTVVIVKAYLNLGNLHIKQRNDNAEFYLTKALNLIKNPKENYLIHQNLSNYYSLKKLYHKSLFHINKSLSFDFKNPENKVVYEDLELLPDKYRTLGKLVQKATILIDNYQVNCNLNDIKLALQNLEIADQLITIIQARSDKDISKVYWRKEASLVYAKAVLCCFYLNKPDEAFYFMEKNKASLLTDAVITNQEKSKSFNHIRVQEEGLQYKLNSLEDYSFLTLQNIQEKEAQKKDLLQQIQKLKDSANTIFRPSHLNTSINGIISSKKVQKQLQENEATVSFLWVNIRENLDYFFVNLVTKDTIKLYRIEASEKIRNWVIDYQQLISQPLRTKKDQQHFKEIAHLLFTALFPQKAFREKIENKKLLIIPDGILQNIPFETLINNYGEYLIFNHPINYAYSCTFLHQNKKLNRSAKGNFIAYAPIQFSNNSLSELPYSQAEAEQLNHILDGTVKTYHKANRADFLQNTKNATIIHLATHADAAEEPKIAFSDSNLMLEELYTYNNKAELVFLSACKTALGEVARGEGVMSLSRGFFYGGANTVIATLWSVNDKSTAFITQQFYQNIKNGDTKANALRKAKLTYLNKHQFSEAAPYYWAGFILTGDYNSSLFTSPGEQFLGLLLIVTALFLLFIISPVSKLPSWLISRLN